MARLRAGLAWLACGSGLLLGFWLRSWLGSCRALHLLGRPLGRRGDRCPVLDHDAPLFLDPLQLLALGSLPLLDIRARLYRRGVALDHLLAALPGGFLSLALLERAQAGRFCCRRRVGLRRRLTRFHKAALWQHGHLGGAWNWPWRGRHSRLRR